MNLSCSLTTEELRNRKAVVLHGIRDAIVEKTELMDGYRFTFQYSARMVKALTEFIITERACCPFFTFSIVVSGEADRISLQLTGPDGVKAFIHEELGFV